MLACHGGYLAFASLKIKLYLLKGFINIAKFPVRHQYLSRTRPPSMWPENGTIELTELKVVIDL